MDFFYENYSAPNWQGKESLLCNALSIAYLCEDVRTAKDYISSQSDRFKSVWAFDQLRMLATYWGPEFFDIESELYIDYSIGGWLNQTSYSLSTSLLDMEHLEAIGYKEELISFAFAMVSNYIKKPKLEYKTPAEVSNHLYSGPAKKSDPRVQIFTLGTEDIISFYLKLTTFQRNYTKRKLNFSRQPIRKLLSIIEIMRKKLMTKPWHCIPDRLVDYQTWTNTGYGFVLPAESELARHDNDPISSMLEGDVDERDSIFTWDPKIPSYAIDRQIQTSVRMYHNCSQFSNTGAIPILEYFYRNRIYPQTRMIGRQREPPHPDLPSEPNCRQPPGIRYHNELCQRDIPDYETEISERSNSDDEYEGIDGILGTVNDHLRELKDLKHTAYESAFTAEDLQNKSKDELLDQLLAADDTKYDHENREEFSITDDIFDNSDEDLGLDFF